MENDLFLFFVLLTLILTGFSVLIWTIAFTNKRNFDFERMRMNEELESVKSELIAAKMELSLLERLELKMVETELIKIKRARI